MRATLGFIVGSLVLAVLFAATAEGQEKVDKYGGLMDIKGTAGEFFSVQKIGNRWWVVTPDGHGTFIKTVSKVDTNTRNVDCGGSGGFRSYDALYLQHKDGRLSTNLKDAATSTIPGDVVDAKRRVTVKAAGDALYLGCARFKPNFTYVWLGRVGVGGKMQWYYSTGKGWKLINKTGKPFTCVAKNADGSYSFDVGNYMAPDANGFGVWNNKGANKIIWFDVAKVGFPADFAPMALPGDATPRYYIKGVVTEAFTTEPVLNQTYERALFDETIQRKYGPGDWNRTWAKAITQRLKGWGYNAAGMYSGRYVQLGAPKLDDRLPVEPTWQLGGWAIKKGSGYHVKNVYSGAVFPPGGRLGWHGVQPDVFDPMFEKAYMELAAKQLPKLDPWSWALIPEEADYLYGLNSLSHNHMGYVVLSQNPHRAEDTKAKISYSDARFYAKYALRDLLRYRYKDAGEKLAAFTIDSRVPAYAYAANPEGAELAALENLNKAWGTRYTTWGTSDGDLAKGTNAYGKGTGFMDEDGKSVLAKGVRNAAFNSKFTKAELPAIRRDMDNFLALFAARYGKVLAKACNQQPHPPLLLPLYNGPGIVYKAVAPYVDGFWVSLNKPRENALRIYNAGHKPLLIADYTTASPDSPSYFKGRIETIKYDPATNRTIIYGPDIRYIFRTAWFIQFPGAAKLQKARVSRGMVTHPRVSAVRWNTLEIPRDYTKYIKPGMTVEFYGRYRPPGSLPPARTQQERAERMIGRYDSLLNLTGDDGKYFVVGFEHWCLYDDGVNNWSETDNFGIATIQDNAYDGKEARRAVGVDARGYPVGGEEADYGNLMDPLGKYLRGITGKIRK